MKLMPADLPPEPTFESPPIEELAISVQFEPLRELRSPHMGLFWATVKDRFPNVEEHEPIRNVVETFGPRRRPQVQFAITRGVPTNRVWFLNARGTELLQLQPDRFVRNWRSRESGEPYPSYTQMRGRFAEELQRLESFLGENQLGQLSPSQCELTYVDHIEVGECPRSQGDLGSLLNTVVAEYRDDELGEPEEASYGLRFVLHDDAGEPYGRIRLTAKPGRRKSDDRALFVLETVGRGRPIAPGLEGALTTLDRIHDAIYGLFERVTRTRMHERWGKRS